MSSNRRLLCALALLLAFALPLAAEASPAAGAAPAGSLLATVWESLTSPLAALWELAVAPAPLPPPAPGDTSDGRSTIDPLGGR
jgi:hypothetical protein